MGLFKKFKEINAQNKETDITKMKFQRFTGFVGSMPQKFCDTAVPACPVCKQEKPWILHVAQKNVKLFPVGIIDHTYHLKCEKCGMVMHTVIRQTGDNMPQTVTRPTPGDASTMMTIDVIGEQESETLQVGQSLTIADLNKLV